MTIGLINKLLSVFRRYSLTMFNLQLQIILGALFLVFERHKIYRDGLFYLDQDLPDLSSAVPRVNTNFDNILPKEKINPANPIQLSST